LAREQRKLAAIVCADVIGFSRLIGQDEAGTLSRLKSLRVELIDPTIAEHGGRIVKTTGDGLLLEFGSVVDAVRCAVAVQQEMAHRGIALPEDRRIAFRIGVHMGDIVIDGDDILGHGVNVAARLEGLAEPGGVCVSGRVQEDLAGKLDLELQDGGEHSLKNIARPVRVWRWSPARTASVASATLLGPADGVLPLPDKPSLAVLPFDNLSGDPEQTYFADGLAEDLITGLSRVSWLFVIARNSSFTFRGEKLDVRSIGERLGVRYVVEGSVRRAGQRLRLTVQLIEAASGNHLWADRYDGLLEDVFDFQDRIVASLVGTIEPKLRVTEIARARRKRPESLDAFDLYLQALPKVATFSVQGIGEAIKLLDESIGLSPNYAQALAYAALARALRPIQNYSPDDARDFREASELLRRAFDADSMDPVALSVAGFLAAMLRRDYQAGWDLIDRALAINPNDALSWSIRGWINAWAGETEIAVAEFEKAMRLSPLDPQWGTTFKQGMAIALCWAGRSEEALPWVRSALQERPDWSVASTLLIAALWLTGRHTEAREAARRHIEKFPRSSVRHAIETSPVRHTPGQERYFDALREAGLPD
jgi:TolB-like protein/class 3 adenylate cyclase